MVRTDTSVLWINTQRKETLVTHLIFVEHLSYIDIYLIWFPCLFSRIIKISLKNRWFQLPFLLRRTRKISQKTVVLQQCSLIMFTEIFPDDNLNLTENTLVYDVVLTGWQNLRRGELLHCHLWCWTHSEDSMWQLRLMLSDYSFVFSGLYGAHRDIQRQSASQGWCKQTLQLL